MGSYAECWLDSLYVGSTKNDFDGTLMQLFRASDKVQLRGIKKELRGIEKEPPIQMRRWMDYVEDDTEECTVVYYAAPAYVVRDRLELKGYTLDTAKVAFMKCIQAEARRCAEAQKQLAEFYEPILPLLKTLDINQWLAALGEIRENRFGGPGSREGPYDGTLVDYMLKHEWYGYSGADLSIPLRLALETCSGDDRFTYDLTDLIRSEYFSADDDFVAIASEGIAAEHTTSTKIIILTEGRSDSWVISESMKLLYPHLSDYFSFMDFEAARVGGGAGNLASIVKSFAGAGILNKVLAIFDNDAAGEVAMRMLRQVRLPANIRVMQLPRLDMLSRYPTIGPSGTTVMDINGMAASIELYLGTDVLSEESNLVPVQWMGYEASLGMYQGEVLAKDRIQERFKKKLRECTENPDSIDQERWSGVQEILRCILASFHTYDGEQILASLDPDGGES